MKGYRSVDDQQYKTIIELSGEILGKKFKNIIKKFDRMRRKRNQFTYDPFLPVSKTEAENALKTAEEFVKIALKLVQEENPQLRFSFNNGTNRIIEKVYFLNNLVTFRGGAIRLRSFLTRWLRL